jgi:hypothetical protein
MISGRIGTDDRFPVLLGAPRRSAPSDGLSCEDISVAVTPVAPSIFDFEGSKKAGLAVSPVA